MKIIAFTRVHYGADYLAYVIRATQDFAEQHMVIYSPQVSLGFTATELACPDSRSDLYRLAHNAAGKRLVWLEDAPLRVETVREMFPSADVILELDADEIPHRSLLDDILRRMERGELKAQMYRLPFLHHWRSFKHVCKDGNWPVRLYLPKNYGGDIEFWPDGYANGAIHHFGYARQLNDMRYKLDVSAHRSEFRPRWWEDTFLAYPDRLTDLHPVCVDGFWNAEFIDRRALPAVLRNHPFFNLEVIE